MDMMLLPYRRYADFKGRSRRSEYWMFRLFAVGALALAAVLMSVLSPGFSDDSEISLVGALVAGILGIGIIASMIPAIALSVRRLHDIDRTGWWLLIAIVPYLGSFALFILSLLDGTPGPNRFGEDPKNRISPDADVF